MKQNKLFKAKDGEVEAGIHKMPQLIGHDIATEMAAARKYEDATGNQYGRSKDNQFLEYVPHGTF
jgi:hypothetical protein